MMGGGGLSLRFRCIHWDHPLEFSPDDTLPSAETSRSLAPPERPKLALGSEFGGSSSLTGTGEGRAPRKKETNQPPLKLSPLRRHAHTDHRRRA